LGMGVAPGPMHSVRVCGRGGPLLAQRAATKGSPRNRPSMGSSLPEAVAIEVGRMERMRMAMASPTSAPSTYTGLVTSCPPHNDGVIIGPQQPGVVLATMYPPFLTGPSMGWAGSSSPLVNSLTNTVSWASWTRLLNAFASFLARLILRIVF